MKWKMFLLCGIVWPFSASTQDCHPHSLADIINVQFQQYQRVTFEVPDSIEVTSGSLLLLDTLVDVMGMGEYSFSWSAKVDGKVSNIPNLYEATENATLFFNLLYPDGCGQEDSLQLIVDELLGSKEHYRDLSFKIFPNPTSSTAFLSLNHQSDPLDIVVFNSLGKIVLEQRKACMTGYCTYQLNLNGWLSGLYIVQVRSKNRWGIQLFAINK